VIKIILFVNITIYTYINMNMKYIKIANQLTQSDEESDASNINDISNCHTIQHNTIE